MIDLLNRFARLSHFYTGMKTLSGFQMCVVSAFRRTIGKSG